MSINIVDLVRLTEQSEVCLVLCLSNGSGR